ncbi:Leucine-rich repeat receptor-like tyrosine-protein kinase PXC3 [Frankliniella fusca]|uniref:Leucine-rich repeat receptor-like tyrosine-protein kinase PXC3 n=1 Tax=Frankliniella fusca TaxID=407009 RepID=A0AAE1I1N5_9NEOP|nr:Leucine-rich repeat receptor-like tyrosine-protein kinase PXC3 [Frankliniella fusca]
MERWNRQVGRNKKQRTMEPEVGREDSMELASEIEPSLSILDLPPEVIMSVVVGMNCSKPFMFGRVED